MTTYDDLIRRWDACNGGQLLVDAQHPIAEMYLNVNAHGNRELLIPVKKPVTTFESTEAIGVSNYKAQAQWFFAIELLTESLIKEYACLCFELIQSSKQCRSTSAALEVLFDTFRKWYDLMANVHRDILPLNEIRGIMGEIEFMIDEIDDGKNEAEVVHAWTVHKDASRDFIYDDVWDEVKTVKSTSDYVTISSIEQLDHNMDGHLIVYCLDQANADEKGVWTLNSIIQELCQRLSMAAEAELSRKLLTKGYVYNVQYDQYSFVFKKRNSFFVNSDFPRISRAMLSPAIKAARYEIFLTEIEEWREADGE